LSLLMIDRDSLDILDLLIIDRVSFSLSELLALSLDLKVSVLNLTAPFSLLSPLFSCFHNFHLDRNLIASSSLLSALPFMSVPSHSEVQKAAQGLTARPVSSLADQQSGQMASSTPSSHLDTQTAEGSAVLPAMAQESESKSSEARGLQPSLRPIEQKNSKDHHRIARASKRGDERHKPTSFGSTRLALSSVAQTSRRTQ